MPGTAAPSTNKAAIVIGGDAGKVAGRAYCAMRCAKLQMECESLRSPPAFFTKEQH